MTFTIPGEEPEGYTFRAENIPARQIIEVLEQAIGRNGDLAFPDFYGNDSTEERLQTIAKLNGIDYLDQYSYDSDDFPKPVYADQLTCSDSDWSELAPSHTFEFIPREDGTAHCILCGIEEAPRG